jgi:hypothetical protein
VFVTIAISATTPMDLEVRDGLAVITFGENAPVALEFTDTHAVDRIRSMASAAITALMGQHSADPDAVPDATSQPKRPWPDDDPEAA